MNSQINNQNENKEVFSEEQFRNPFFETATKRSRPSNPDKSQKRVRIDADALPVNKPTAAAAHHKVSISSKRTLRSRSLPNLMFPSLLRGKKSRVLATHCVAQDFKISPPLPPVNLQSLREIDLHDILKNPQLRHDILFDPQLQFRPNLDGERGRRKKLVVDRYWSDVRSECIAYFKYPATFDASRSRLPSLFKTLRDILSSLLPSKDRNSVKEIVDCDMLVLQLQKGALDFVALATWLSSIFKSHCAPMRDAWVDDMMSKFVSARTEKSVEKSTWLLVDGLRSVFSILEAMKLDVANHQIRILRPALVSTAVEFEKDYVDQMVSRNKLNLSDSLDWFDGCKATKSGEKLRSKCARSIISLLSCRKMCNEFPASLSFDHARLVLLRSDIRQVVCLQVCALLYKQLVLAHSPAELKPILLTRVDSIKKEITSIITDDNGNVKWTRNLSSIALQLARRAINEPEALASNCKTPSKRLVDFAFNWLVKQTQPSTDIYGILENKIFNELESRVVEKMDNDNRSAGDFSKQHSELVRSGQDYDEMHSLALRMAILVKFHWDVFGSYYTRALHDNE